MPIPHVADDNRRRPGIPIDRSCDGMPAFRLRSDFNPFPQIELEWSFVSGESQFHGGYTTDPPRK